MSRQKLSNMGYSGCLLAYAIKDLMVVCHCVLINLALLWLYSVPFCTIQATSHEQQSMEESCAQSSLLLTLNNW